MVFRTIFTAMLVTTNILLSISQCANANDFKIVGTVKHTLKQNQVRGDSATKTDKQIQLLHVELSEQAKSVLAERGLDAIMNANNTSDEKPSYQSLPCKVQLGMNHVPVLDQGIHGTCTTFAMTAIVDAIIGKGDYVSQLCQLQLSSYFDKSFWQGAHASEVINQIQDYGVVSMANQHIYGCGGYHYYPAYFFHNYQSYMTVSNFMSMSEPVVGKVLSWKNIPGVINYNQNAEETLLAVKQALNAGDRIAMTALLPRVEYGSAGAVGKYKTRIAKDTWILTSKIAKDAHKATFSHAMIITGYDDKAIATDSKGNKHRGLLTIRNSWGNLVGDWGDFYMSYDYFKLLAYDIKQFTALS